MAKSGKKGGKYERHDTEYRAKAVRLAQESGNITETAKRMGISRPTLRTWIQEFSVPKVVDPVTANAVAKAIEDASAIRQAFLREHYDSLSEVIRKAISRADELIPKADNLGSIVNAIERLANVIKEFTPADEANPTSTTINLLQQTIESRK